MSAMSLGRKYQMNLRELLGTEKKREPDEDCDLSKDNGPLESNVENALTPDPGSDKKNMELSVVITLTDESQIGRSALVLASTTAPEEERLLKDQIAGFGWKAVATEVGGLAGGLPQKITRAVVGAALNGEIVRKNSNEMHALMHAAFEAMNGFISVGMLEASIGVKIGIVRNRRWIAVAVVGDTAYHAVAHHERCGLGVMHI
jgi:hut operon positive regulator